MSLLFRGNEIIGVISGSSRSASEPLPRYCFPSCLKIQFIFIYEYVSVNAICVQVPMGAGEGVILWSHLTWVLGIEFEFPGRTVSTLSSPQCCFLRIFLALPLGIYPVLCG